MPFPRLSIATTEAWLSHHHAQPTGFDWAVPALRRLSQVRGKLGVRLGTQSEEFDDFDVFPQHSLFTIIYKQKPDFD